MEISCDTVAFFYLRNSLAQVEMGRRSWRAKHVKKVCKFSFMKRVALVYLPGFLDVFICGGIVSR